MKISEAIAGPEVILTPGKIVQLSQPELEARLKQLQALQEKLRKYIQATNSLTYMDDDDEFGSDAKALADRIDAQVGAIRTQIDKLERENQNDSGSELFAVLERECGVALKAMEEAGRFLFRGMRVDDPELNDRNQFIGSSRLNREPTGSNKVKSNYVDHLLIQAGMKALRNNSIYCTANPGQAYNYGSVYLIFPRNGFAFTATDHRDLISVIDHHLFDKKINTEEYQQQLNKPETQAVFAKWWEEHKQDYNWLGYKVEPYLNLTLPAHIDDSQDDYNQDEWEAINYINSFIVHDAQGSSTIPEEVKPRGTRTSAREMIDYINPQNDDFVAALESRKEIMISGEYYAFRSDKWSKKFQSWMRNKTGNTAAFSTDEYV